MIKYREKQEVVTGNLIVKLLTDIAKVISDTKNIHDNISVLYANQEELVQNLSNHKHTISSYGSYTGMSKKINLKHI